MTTVYVKEAQYSYDILKPVVFTMMDSIAGDMITASSRVLIKPNLLAPASPEKAIVTHPLLIKAVAEYVLDRGATPQISDSPAIGSFEKILKVSGIKNALGPLPVRYREFKESTFINAGKPFNKIELASDAINADIVINLPKLKTHTQMLLTLGVKNLFGCVVGMKKPEWHFRTGIDREMFANLLVKIYQAVKPSVTIIDGILAMEGQGPGKSGIPRELGVVLGSSDTVSLDRVVCKMLDIDPDTLLTNKLAGEYGLMTDEINIEGTLPEIKNFKFPEIVPLVFGPKGMQGLMRRHLVQRPECNDTACKLCGECWKYCPAEAITENRKKIHFDYEKCIRCYCCVEVCPHGALSAVETKLGKITRYVLKM